MTAGSSFLRNLAWPLKSKKRHRSGSGGSKEFEQKPKKSLTAAQQRRVTGRRTGSVESSSSSLEIVTPSTSDVEFKYSWPIDRFLHQVNACKSDGLDSKQFEINVNGVLTIWNLSVRFWVGEAGERLANPFVLCLNLVGCRVEGQQDVAVKYKFGIFNRGSEEFEMGAPEKVNIKLEERDKLQSIGYKNIAMSEKHVNSTGDVLLLVRLSIIKKEEPSHSLSSDLGCLINDEASSDLILEAGERRFKVHRSILAARSPVFAALLQKMEEEMKGKEEEERRRVAAEENRIEEETEEAVTCEERGEGEDTGGRDDLVEEPGGDGGGTETGVVIVAENTAVKGADKVEDKVKEKVEDSEEDKVEERVANREQERVDKNINKKLTEKLEEKLKSKVDGERPLKKLVISDLPSDTVEELLRYIYTDNSNNVDLFSQTLLAASDIYQLPGLKVQCEAHLGEIINPLNVAEILLLSDSYGCTNLKKTALSYCNENHSYIMKDSRWKIIEEENPDLFEEAISEIAPETCNQHTDCIKKGGNRYETEKEQCCKDKEKKKHSGLKKYQ